MGGRRFESDHRLSLLQQIGPGTRVRYSGLGSLLSMLLRQDMGIYVEGQAGLSIPDPA